MVLMSLQELMRRIGDYKISDQAGEIQRRPARPLWLLWRRRKSQESRKSFSSRRALLGWNAPQPQLGRPTPHLGNKNGHRC